MMTEDKDKRKIANEKARRLNEFFKALDDFFEDVQPDESNPSYT